MRACRTFVQYPKSILVAALKTGVHLFSRIPYVFRYNLPHFGMSVPQHCGLLRQLQRSVCGIPQSAVHTLCA